MGSSSSDAELLARGRPTDLEEFYLRHVDVVAAFVLRRVARRENTVDAVAETFARALAARRQYRPSRGPAIAWLLGIARNLLIDEARRDRLARTTQVRLGMERVVVTDVDLDAIDERVALSVEAALGALPEGQRDAVRRRVLLDETYAQIAEGTGCTEQVIRQRVHRGLQTLRTTVPQEL